MTEPLRPRPLGPHSPPHRTARPGPVPRTAPTGATGASRPPLALVGGATEDSGLLGALASATLVGAWRAHTGHEAELFGIEVRVGPDRPVTFFIRVDHARSSTISHAAMTPTDLVSAVELASVLHADGLGLLWHRGDHAGIRATIEHALDVPRPPVGVDTFHPSQRLRPALAQLMACLPTGDARTAAEDAAEDRDIARTRRIEPIYRPRRHDDHCEELQLRVGHGMRSRRFGATLQAELRALVGGAEALASLDTATLPDEPFDWEGVPDDVGDRTQQILELCDRACKQHFDVEVRTASRRLVHHIATQAPASLRGRGSVHTFAAAVVWAVATRNHLLGSRTLTTKDLLEGFAVGGSVSSRAAGLLRAAGLRTDAHAPEFRSEFLTGARRSELVSMRDAVARLRVVRIRVRLDGTSPPVERVVEVDRDETLDHLHEVLQQLFGWHGIGPAEFRIGELAAGVGATAVDRRPGHGGPTGLGWNGWDDDGPIDLDDVLDRTDLRRGALRQVDAADGDPVAIDPVAIEPVAIEPVAIEPVAIEPVAMKEVGIGVVSVGDTFTYRYASRWRHTLTVESVTPMSDHDAMLPTLVSASRAAPPEAVGDPAGYQRLLDLMDTDREHELDGQPDSFLPARPGSFDPWRPDPDAVDLAELAGALSPLES